MKYIILCFLCAIVSACTDSAENKIQEVNKTESTDSLINNPGLMTNSVYIKGARLVAANDCLGCHKINVKGIGPSYDSIAARYALTEGNVENLSYKIIHGGKGRWGDKVAMTPHANLQPDDAAEMVKYVLSLRNRTDSIDKTE